MKDNNLVVGHSQGYYDNSNLESLRKKPIPPPTRLIKEGGLSFNKVDDDTSKKAEENYRKFKKIDDLIKESAEIAGITKEQAYKFMDSLAKLK
jgi:hypothetical protein